MDGLFGRSSSEKPSLQDEVRLLKPAEIAGFMAITAQCFSNGFVRQAAANLKLMADFENAKGWAIVNMVKKDPKTVFTSGMMARLGYQAVGILPALVVRQKLMESGANNFQISFGVSVTETLVRAPFEISRIQDVILKKQGVEIDVKQKVNLWHRSFYPFFFRNYLAWAVINQSPDNLFEKMSYGVISGIASTPLETLGNLVIKHSVKSHSMEDAYRKAFEDVQVGEKTVARNIAANLFRGTGIRAFAGAFSAVLLSPDLGEMLTTKFTPTISKFCELCVDEKKEVLPESSVLEPSSVKVSEGRSEGESAKTK